MQQQKQTHFAMKVERVEPGGVHLYPSYVWESETAVSWSKAEDPK
jgi:hypothetical protein